MFVVCAFFMMLTFIRLADEHCRQVGEDKRLNKRYQYLNQVNEYGEGNENGRRPIAQHFTHFTENKNQTNKAQDDDVPGGHVCKQTND